MNTIKQLLQTFCPNGVEFRELGEIGQFYSGLSGKSKDDFKDGNAKFITYMNVYSNPSTNLEDDSYVTISPNENQNAIEQGDVLFTGSSETPDECGMSSVVVDKIEESYYLNSFCFGFRLNDKSRFDYGYLKHLLRDKYIRKQIAKTANGVTRFNVSKKLFAKIEIPIPPIAVQHKIVEILDNFTDLEAELEAELEARKKQYTYYRNQLLSFSDNKNVEWKALGEICKIKNGKDYKHLSSGNIPVYGTGGIMTYVDTAAYDKPSVLLPRKGSIDKVYYVETPFWTVDTIYWTLIDTDIVVPKYFYYFMTTINLNKYNTGIGAIPSLTQAVLNKIKTPVPALSVQHRIVSILDRFESLVNDISSGLPAEIKARHQQYESYRGQLLTFKRKA